jgi:hypothetical protein
MATRKNLTQTTSEDQTMPTPKDERLEVLSRTFIKRIGNTNKTFLVQLDKGASEEAIDFVRRGGYVPTDDIRQRPEHARSVLELAARMIVRSLGITQGVLDENSEKWTKADRDNVQAGVDELLENADNEQFTAMLKTEAEELVENYVPERRERTTTKKAAANGKKISLFAKAAE